MDKLEPLAAELREELGAPPDSWQKAQRARFRDALREPRGSRLSLLRLFPRLVTALVIVGVLVWFGARATRPDALDRWLVAEEMKEPFRFEDGSSIALSAGGRGRISADATAVRFDLHHGHAHFDVTPGQRRTWKISAGKNEVRVVGTRFSVLYGPAETFEVGVERGIVSVRVPDRNASVELAAGDRLRGRPGQMEVVHGTSPAAAENVPSTNSSALAASASASAIDPEHDTPLARRESTSPSPQKTEAQHAGRQGTEPTPDADWQAAYRAGKYAESLALLRTSGIVQRLNDLPPGTLAIVADAARLGGDPELAVRGLTTLLRRFPRAVEARHGKFLLGRVYALHGDRAAAIAAFESYLQADGSAAYANEALGRLIELYSTRGDAEKARGVARRYLERAPEGPYRRLARSLLDQPL